MRIASVQNIALILLMMGAGGQGGNWLPASITHFLGTHAAIAAQEKFDMGALLQQIRAEQVAVMAQQQRGVMAASGALSGAFNFATNQTGGGSTLGAVSVANVSSAGNAEATQVMQTVMAEMGKGEVLNLISELN